MSRGKNRPLPAREPPPAVRPGDTVGIVAPAGPVDPQRLEAGIARLRQKGYRVKMGRYVYKRDGFFAGTDRQRAEDLCRMLEDPAVGAVFCARGGYGSQRLLPLIAPLMQRFSPKSVIGYSDVTALHCLLLRAGWQSWHGPMAGDGQVQRDGGFSFDLLLALLAGETTVVIPLPPGARLETLHPGTARGPLVGGNLSLLAALLGSPYEVPTEGAILFLEDVGEAPYRIDRMLSSLSLAGKLAPLRGVILGEFTDCMPPPGAPPVTVDEVLSAHFAGLGIPVLKGFPAGHGRINVPLPLGCEVELDAGAGRITMVSPAVRG